LLRGESFKSLSTNLTIQVFGHSFSAYEEEVLVVPGEFRLFTPSPSSLEQSGAHQVSSCTEGRGKEAIILGDANQKMNEHEHM
jgi:hypothetical protein